MSTPTRIQLSRRKGWRMPPGAVKVDRSTRWGNPFTRQERGDAQTAVAEFENLLAHPTSSDFPQKLRELGTAMRRDAHQLRGKSLACWCRLCPKHAAGKPLGTDCPDCAPCHADVLLELAAEP